MLRVLLKLPVAFFACFLGVTAVYAEPVELSSVDIPRAQGIDVENAYVHVPIAGRQVTAAYMILVNNDTQSRTLVAVETQAAGRAEIHSHSHIDGVMRMRREEAIELGAGERVEFAPGGLHIMLFELAPGLQTGQELHLTLVFHDGTRLPVVAIARSRFDKPHH